MADDELLERDSQRAVIDATLRAARHGDGGVLVVEAAAGLGKSRLLQELRHAAAPTMRVLTARVGELRAPNVRLERFVPHAAVLPHLAAVVCHGGMGTVQKAVGHGVPLVVVPFGRDQPEVARRVERAGAGVRLPARRLTAPRLRAAVQQALDMRPQARAAAQRLAASGGPERFVDAIDALLTPASRPTRRRAPSRHAAARRGPSMAGWH